MAETQRLILASGSSGRRELLTRAGHRFDVIPANIDEPTGEGVTDIRRFVQEVAWRKAAAVAPTIEGDAVVLAADSVVWHRGQIIGKPADEADARRILSSLSGTTHELWTGVVLWRRPDDVQLAWQALSRVRFKALSKKELDDLLATGDWRGKSGGYGIQAIADPFITVEEGTFSNVVGLPMEDLARALPLLTN